MSSAVYYMTRPHPTRRVRSRPPLWCRTPTERVRSTFVPNAWGARKQNKKKQWSVPVFTCVRAGARMYQRGKCLENLCGVRSLSRSLSGPDVCEMGPRAVLANPVSWNQLSCQFTVASPLPLRVLPSSSRIGVKLIYLLWVLIRVPSLWSSSRVCLNIFLSVFFSFFWYKSQRSDTLL